MIDYECIYCGAEHPDFHYCNDCGEELSMGTCYRYEGLCADCAGLEE